MAEREFTGAELEERLAREWPEFVRHPGYDPSPDGRGMLCEEAGSWGLILRDARGLCLWSLSPAPGGDGRCAVRVPVWQDRLVRAFTQRFVNGIEV